MKNKIMAVLAGAAILTAGCAQHQKPDATTLQGTWNGRQLNNTSDHQCSLIISGNNYEFQDEADSNSWNKGTFTLREDTNPRQYIAVVSECHVPQFEGKTVMAIYRLENDTLTMASSAPGKSEAPAAFDARGVAQMEFKRK